MQTMIKPSTTKLRSTLVGRAWLLADLHPYAVHLRTEMRVLRQCKGERRIMRSMYNKLAIQVQENGKNGEGDVL
jgi:hypothetical protein